MKRALFLVSIISLVLAGCKTTEVKPDPSILRVGVTPRSEPMMFKQNGQIMGIEADFAKKLGTALNREIVFVEVPWDKQIDYIEQNKTDIIMSNMSITGVRSQRIHFTTPYLESGLSGLFRRDRYDPNGLIGSVMMNQSRPIGFVENTTGEFFAAQRFPRAEKLAFKTPADGVKALVDGKINMFIHDAPVLWWMAARNERDLVCFPEALNREPLAWGIGRHNAELLEETNELLAQWDEDGTSAKIIQNWIPSFQR